MGSVISRLEGADYGPVPTRAAVAVAGEVKTRPVLDGAERPILLWMHRLGPGATLSWDRPVQDHLLFVWEGGVVAEGQPLGANEAFVVEHGGTGQVTCGDVASTVLHFHRPEDYPHPAPRGGGHTHLLAGARVMRGWERKMAMGRTLFADAACPTCEVWLHGSQLPPLWPVVPHYHTEDEIIVVTQGEIRLGRVGYGPGAVLAVDAETRYAFSSGEDGLSFINYRPASPVYVMADHSRPPQDERALMLQGLARSEPA